MIEYLPRSKQHSELYLTQFGIEKCIPSHFFGPAIRDHYLLHYVLDGEGTNENWIKWDIFKIYIYVTVILTFKKGLILMKKADK